MSTYDIDFQMITNATLETFLSERNHNTFCFNIQGVFKVKLKKYLFQLI